MRKIVWLILICLLAGLGTSACGGSDTTAVQTYKVVHIAGLYDQFSLDAAQIRALAPGTVLVPAEGAAEIACEPLDEFELCHVQVAESGESGWVEKQWIIVDQ